LALIQYIDRVAISQAKGDVARDMSFTDGQMGAIFAAFGLSYALFGFLGFAGASGLLMTSFYIKDPLLAMLAMGLASFCNDLTTPGSWASCMDLGGKYAGTVSGSMNMMGNFGGMVGPFVVGLVLAATTVTNLTGTTKNWELVFAISSVIYFLSAFFWLFIDPVTPLEAEEPLAAQA